MSRDLEYARERERLTSEQFLEVVLIERRDIVVHHAYKVYS
jgi:hypothetical protein